MNTATSLTKTTCPHTLAGHLSGACAARLLLWLFLWALPTAMRAQFNFTTNNGAITITGYTGTNDIVVIPATTNGYPVTCIGFFAFFGSSLTCVTIGTNVSTIGSGAFSFCACLTSVTIPDSVISIGNDAFAYCGLSSISIPDSVTNIGNGAFNACGLTNVTIPNRIISLGWQAFLWCKSLTSVTMGTNLTSMGDYAFWECTNLTNVNLPDSLVGIGDDDFFSCGKLDSITIPFNVTNIGDGAFQYCVSLTNLFFNGNAPTYASDAFDGDTNATAYAVPGTTGWSSTFAGLPVVMAPGILWPPQSQTAEIGARVDFIPEVAGIPAVTCLWFANGTNLLSCGTNALLELTNVDAAMDGNYTLVVTNAYGAATSAPAMLAVIPVVEHRPVPVVQVTGTAGSVLAVDYVNSLKPALNWTNLGSVNLTKPPQFYFDTSLPLAPQRFYRVWQPGSPVLAPSLTVLGLIPMITLTGTVGDSVELDYISQIGPTNAWGTLGTITLTNTAQPYFDVSALRQPARLYRITTVP